MIGGGGRVAGADKGIPRLIGGTGRPCGGREPRSGGSQEGVLVFPDDRELDLVREVPRGQFDGMPVSEDEFPLFLYVVGKRDGIHSTRAHDNCFHFIILIFQIF